ncbi:MAG: hypothetical protein AAGF12_24500 [Myxococcota bacterium]
MRLGILSLLSVASCATIAPDPGVPDELPHNGTGQFRLLTEDEVGVNGDVDGQAIDLPNFGFDSGAVAGGYLFYAGGALRSDASPQDPLLAVGEVDWAGFEPRQIFRSSPREDFGFAPGTPVLTASLAWEGDAVFEPWVLEASSGEVFLYYRAAGGIGVARASSLDATFERAATEPIFTDGARPSVVQLTDGTFRMYVARNGMVDAASSSDGVSFGALAPIELGTDLLDAESAEMAVSGPGAVAVVTPSDRQLVRLYFESVRQDGQRIMSLAASEDGQVFERFERTVLADPDRRAPAPWVLDPRESLLYSTAPFEDDGRSFRTLVGGFAPAGGDDS